MMARAVLKLIAVSCAFSITGCAMLPSGLRGTEHLYVSGPPVNKIFLAPVPTDAHVESWKQLSSDPRPESKAQEQEGIAAKVESTNKDTAVWASALLQEQGFSLAITDAQLSDLGPDGTAVSIEALKKIQATTGADAVFRFRVTDLGTIPNIAKNWIAVGTGVFIAGAAAVAYSNPETRKYFGAYLASEVVQEGAEIYFGFSIVDYFYRFVRIEAELIDSRTGQVIWQDASTCAGRGPLLKEYPREVRGNTETEIAVALRRALGELVASAREVRGAQQVVPADVARPAGERRG